MSDDEGSGSESEAAPAPAPAAKKTSAAKAPGGLDEAGTELLESNRQERKKMEEEIQELRARNEKRKKERETEEKRLASERAADDERRKALEEDKKKKKEDEDKKRLQDRAKKAAEFEKWKTPAAGRNFVISKKSEGDDEPEEDEQETKESQKKTKEQLDVEKRAILKQRILPLEVDGFDAAKLSEKAKELHKLITRLEGEKFDMEKRYKNQQVDMMELAERARQANKVGKGGLKRIQLAAEEVDRIQDRFAGTPLKVEMYSKYERQKDKREYGERKECYTGPMYVPPPERIKPSRTLKWSEEGLPTYEEMAAEVPEH